MPNGQCAAFLRYSEASDLLCNLAEYEGEDYPASDGHREDTHDERDY